jgi:uncharacterized protein (UPF0276 family)
MTRSPGLKGAGLGLRRTFLDDAIALPGHAVDFWEIAPENWIGVGGPLGRKLRTVAERWPLACHGLSLSIGGPAPLDEDLLDQLKLFLAQHDVRYYTEHLSYCSDGGQLYDLMPIPFTEDAARYVAGRIRHVQDRLERRIGVENVSYYAAPGAELDEIEFLTLVLEEADCDLHLDVNNVLVNAVNHCYDPYAFLSRLPAERVRYGHVAGHYIEAPDLRIDTHGSDVPETVWTLAELAFERFGIFPTAVERDFNIPPLAQLLEEVQRLRLVQQACRATPEGCVS